jgi:hypothetical protein
MKTAIFLLMLTMLVAQVCGAFVAVENGKSNCSIMVDPAAIEPEKRAASELAGFLRLITGAEIPIISAQEPPKENAIVVGPGPLARRMFPDVPFDQLGAEEFVIRTDPQRLLLAGGRPRGTLYAVSRFLQDECGVRWWTPWSSNVPQRASLTVPDLNRRARPAFELREPFWYPAFDPQWAVRHGCNGQSARIPPELGGCVTYKGFVHTFYPLVPPAKHFAEHPEWFSLLKGKRTADRAQLCLTNPKLRDFVAGQVKQWLRESPEAAIISVSQNDWHGACECAECKALDDAEGSHAGTLLAFVNDIAEKIEPDFPRVAIDTLAYQYTRKPPKTLRPRANVIVRLCSIECNFREPLDHPSNAAFARDMEGWSKICERLYIWDYTTDFAHYVQPHPNWFTLGRNVRFFQRHNVRGVFEQGAYQSHGSEMAELRAWVLAQLLWDPTRDDQALIDEFLGGYYGAAAKPIRNYLALLHEASQGHKLTCFSPTDVPFLTFKTLAQAEQLWRQAEAVVHGDPELLARVRLGHLPLGYVWLSGWTHLRRECRDQGAEWPLPDSRKQVADEWLTVANGLPGAPWTKVTLLNEAGLTPEKFIARFAENPPEPEAGGTQKTSPPAIPPK